MERKDITLSVWLMLHNILRNAFHKKDAEKFEKILLKDVVEEIATTHSANFTSADVQKAAGKIMLKKCGIEI